MSAPSGNGCPFMQGPPPGAAPLEVTYWDYIATDRILNSQNAAGQGLHHHDEHLFILVHQVFELWFKQIIRELESVRAFLIASAEMQSPAVITAETAVSQLMRSEKILRHALGIFGVLETMHPSSFAEFRDFIGPASGFQSLQMREMEILLGLDPTDRIQKDGKQYYEAMGPAQRAVIEKRSGEPTLKSALNAFLAQLQVPPAFERVFLEGKEQHLKAQKMLWFAGDASRADPAIQAEMDPVRDYLKAEGLSEIEKRARLAALYCEEYRDSGDSQIHIIAQMLEQVVALEEAHVLWRHYHARMVERMIGRRAGTGGSSGVEYLDATAKYRVFRDLWHTRSVFVKSSALPGLNELRAMQM